MLLLSFPQTRKKKKILHLFFIHIIPIVEPTFIFGQNSSICQAVNWLVSLLRSQFLHF